MMKSNKIFLETMEIDMSVEDCTNELLALQMELWPSCQVLPGAEVRLCLLWTFLSRRASRGVLPYSIFRYASSDFSGT